MFHSASALQRRSFIARSAALACSAVPLAGWTQAPFPSKTVTLVVPFTPGSGSDTIARLVAPKLSAAWGQAVIVDNRPGASGNLGAKTVAMAAPDGHTLLIAISTLTMAPALYKNTPFDVVKDFSPVGKLADTGFALAVHPSVPATTMAALIAYVKKHPGATNYATPGNGTPQHLAMELLKSSVGIETTHVPYKGIQGALTDLIGGQVQMAFASVPSLRPHALAGRVRLLAVTGTGRSPLAPEVPSFREQGISVMDNVDAWYAVLAPAHTPAELVARLNADFRTAIQSPDLKAQLEAQGFTLRTSTAPELAALLKSDLERWRQVVASAHITAD